MILGPRAYDPAMGRFLQRDPIAVLWRSTTANPYAFAGSDPMNDADPTGLCGEKMDCPNVMLTLATGAAMTAGWVLSGHSGRSSTPPGVNYGVSGVNVGGTGTAIDDGAAGNAVHTLANNGWLHQLGGPAWNLFIDDANEAVNVRYGHRSRRDFLKIYGSNKLRGGGEAANVLLAYSGTPFGPVINSALHSLADSLDPRVKPLNLKQMMDKMSQDMAAAVPPGGGAGPRTTPSGVAGGATPAGYSRVGRWMSPDELAAMQSTGRVQAGGGGVHRVAFPADPEAYQAAPPGDLFVSYDVPTASLRPAGTGAWRQIVGPDSVFGRLAARRGDPLPEMPEFLNLTVERVK